MPELRRPQVHGTTTHGTIVHYSVEQISQTSTDQLATTIIKFCGSPTFTTSEQGLQADIAAPLSANLTPMCFGAIGVGGPMP
jgi:hypothetical protein